MEKNPTRFIELDILRGVAIVGMITFHYFFILDFLKIGSYEIDNGFLLILARVVQFLFLTLVGVSLAISHKKNVIKNLPIKNFYLSQLKRTAKIIGFAMLITLVTWLVIPQHYVAFGILHLIGISILILAPLAGQKMIVFLLAIIAYNLRYFVENIKVSPRWLQVLGFDVGGVSSIDHFPIFPWISLVLLGIGLGNILYKNFKSKIKFNDPPKPFSMLAWFGQNSLIIYVTHIPLLFLLIFVMQFLKIL